MVDPVALPMRNSRRVHFVGIGGAGMGGIAEVLHNLGYTVTGSDRGEGAMVRHLRGLGIDVRQGHLAEQVSGSDVLVVSSAIAADNPELVAARAARIPIVPRAEMLAELMRFRHGIAIAGTHGKTTTTSLIAAVLAEGGLDPTYVIGGRLNSSASHGRLGAGHYLVAEADESDASFLHLQPMIAVVTNIDAEHMSTYGGDFERLQRAFVDFVHRLPFYGLAVVCLDDPNAARLLPELRSAVVTYGTDPHADLHAYDIRQERGTMHFRVRRQGQEWLEVTLNLAGWHNVRNSLAALAVGHELGVDDAALGRALRGFAGINRRLQSFGERRIGAARVMIIDDYGHHPTEIQAVLEAIRAGWPGRRLVVAFQPHRYSRTRDLFDDFVRCLSQIDELLLLDIYPAGEHRIAGADGRALAQAIRARGQVLPIYLAAAAEVFDVLPGIVRDGDIVLLLGAGDIGQIAPRLAELYAAEPPA
ncbi:MAG: UDP-N-acetylmuramate--L-alanine ligase [Gammaproteobacteria bacterium]|nr:UDP-N-acetylmuramate--L-alanine ligase [Gammaproteobacteria bacterium]